MAFAEPVGEASIAFLYDTNVTRANLREDIRADAYAEARMGGGWRTDLPQHGSVELDGALRGSRYARFNGLSSVAVEASASAYRKLGLGLAAPWISAGATIAHEDFVDDTRDSNRWEARIEAGRRIDAALDVAAGVAYDRRYARHREVLVPGISGAVWDVRGTSVYARGSYAPDARWQLDAGVAVRRGDVVATTRRHIDIFLASDAIAESNSFDDDFYDYRLRGTTRTATLGASYALGVASSLNVGYALASTRASQGLDYRNHLVSVTWMYRQ